MRIGLAGDNDRLQESFSARTIFEICGVQELFRARIIFEIALDNGIIIVYNVGNNQSRRLK